jgi:hypothetical protein
MPQYLPFPPGNLYSHFRPDITISGISGNVPLAAVVAVHVFPAYLLPIDMRRYQTNRKGQIDSVFMAPSGISPIATATWRRYRNPFGHVLAFLCLTVSNSGFEVHPDQRSRAK